METIPNGIHRVFPPVVKVGEEHYPFKAARIPVIGEDDTTLYYRSPFLLDCTPRRPVFNFDAIIKPDTKIPGDELWELFLVKYGSVSKSEWSNLLRLNLEVTLPWGTYRSAPEKQVSPFPRVVFRNFTPNTGVHIFNYSLPVDPKNIDELETIKLVFS